MLNDKTDPIEEHAEEQKLIIFLKITKEVLLNSTSHGLPNILRNENKIIKITWTIFLLISTALCSYLVIQSISSYLKFDVTTKTRRIYESPTLFPTIRICNRQLYTSDYAIEFLKNVINKYKFDDIFNESVYDKYRVNMKSLKDYVYNLSLSGNIELLQSNITDEQRKKVHYKLEDILIDCSFNGGDECSAQDFDWVYKELWGNCYGMNLANSTKFKYSNFYGKFYSLSMILFMGMKDELKFLKRARGLTLNIFNNTKQYFGTLVDLPIGFDANVQIDRYFVNQLPKPYSNCDIDDENPNGFKSRLYNKTIQNNLEYNQQSCLELCYQELAIKSCNCSDLEGVLFKGDKICTFESSACLNQVFDKFLSPDYVKDNCFPECPLECSQASFGVSLTSSVIMPEYYSKIVQGKAKSLNITNETWSLEEVKNNIIKFNIYYGTGSYSITTESPSLDMIGLLAYIGGTLGLFLGVSLLTTVEVIEIFLSFFSEMIKNK
jgi:hypothetical protein